MANVFVVRTVDQALEMLRTLAHDGDTIRLVWDGASKHSEQVVESTAVGLGLNVVVEVGHPRMALEYTNDGKEIGR